MSVYDVLLKKTNKKTIAVLKYHQFFPLTIIFLFFGLCFLHET